MKKIKFTLILLLLVNLLHAQQTPAFWSDIQNFKKQDSVQSPPQHAILFVGSSSFTKWSDVQSYFPGYTIINRGFGGSSLPDVIRYENDVIFKYNPKQIVIYCGENDIAGSSEVTGQIVFERFEQLFKDIRAKYPTVPIIYISMKPSPSRWSMKDKMIEGNKLIKKFLEMQKKTVFVNVWNGMLGADGKPKPDIFIEDKLHMNAKGYAIWQKKLKPLLVK
jgi:lysophospholipase L1-like esterase